MRSWARRLEASQRDKRAAERARANAGASGRGVPYGERVAVGGLLALMSKHMSEGELHQPRLCAVINIPEDDRIIAAAACPILVLSAGRRGLHLPPGELLILDDDALHLDHQMKLLEADLDVSGVMPVPHLIGEPTALGEHLLGLFHAE